MNDNAWTQWDQERLDILRGSFQRAGWTLTDHGPSSDTYELDLGAEGVAEGIVPRTTEGRDTNLTATVAATNLILVSGEPHLEVGPLSPREAAYAQALASARPAAGSPERPDRDGPSSDMVVRRTAPGAGRGPDHPTGLAAPDGARAEITAEELGR
jgi:hypothetical protein